MTPDEFLYIRLRNGKICDGVSLGKKGELIISHNGLKMPQHNDYTYITNVGKTMEEFWDNAKSQKQLLWMLRGLGMDTLADELWNFLADAFDIKLHVTVISPSQAQLNADIIRNKTKCPTRK